MNDRPHNSRPRNREEVHEAKERAARADLEELKNINGLFGHAEGALAKQKYLMKQGMEPDYAALSTGWRAWVVRAPMIVVSAIILIGLGIKYFT